MTVVPPRRVVMVGAGIAGVATCAGLRAAGYRGDLLLIDAGERPYDRPPLSKGYLAGQKDGEAIALQPSQWYAEHQVELMSETTVLGLDTGTLTVSTSAGDVSGDAVVIATGGRAAVPPVPGVADARVHVLRDVEDAERLRDALRPGCRVLVVGAGLIGAEAASTLVDLGMSVTMVDPVDPPLAAVVGTAVARWMHDSHVERGIDLRHAGVARLVASPEGIVAHLDDGSTPVVVDQVLLGVGMVPRDELAAVAGLDVDRGVLVDHCQRTSRPGVFAIGDVARQRDEAGLPLPRVEHWEGAQDGAARLVAHLMGLDAPADRAPWFWSDRHGHHVEVVGALVDGSELVWRGDPSAAPFAVFAIEGDRLLGAVAVDDTKVVRAARRIIDQQIRVDPAALADVSTDPRQLVRPAGGVPAHGTTRGASAVRTV